MQNSCFELKADPVDYGPPTSLEKIDSELNAPLQARSPFDIQKGEFVVLEENQTLATGKPLVLADIGLTVIGREESNEGNLVELIWLEESYRYSGDQTQHQIKEHRRTLERSRSTSVIDRKNVVEAPLKALAAKVQTLSPSVKILAGNEDVVTYHDLVVTHTQSLPPAAVVEDPQCGGLNPCLIHTVNVSYSEVLWRKDQEPQKVEYVFRLSPDVPYFARVMDLCITAMVPIQGQRYRVMQCTHVRKFHFSKESPTPTAAPAETGFARSI
jgi:hypothetical protein